MKSRSCTNGPCSGDDQRAHAEYQRDRQPGDAFGGAWSRCIERDANNSVCNDEPNQPFTGRINGDTIDGDFLTRGEYWLRQTGKWSVRRARIAAR